MNRTAGPQNHAVPLGVALFTIFLCAMFGSNAVALKIVFTGIGPFTFAGIRFAIGGVLIYIWARFTGRPLSLTSLQLKQMLFLSAVFTLQFTLFHMGLNKTNASRASLLINIQPFFLAILAHFFIQGDTITLRKIAGMALGFAGVVIVFLEQSGITPDFQVGDTIVIASAFLWACNMAYTKRIIHTFQPFQIALYTMLFSVPVFLVEGYLWDPAMILQIDAKVIGAVIFSSVLVATFGFVAWQTLLQRYSAVSLHSFIFIMPIAGVLFGGLLLDEPVTPLILLSLLLLVSGIITVNAGVKKRGPSGPLQSE